MPDHDPQRTLVSLPGKITVSARETLVLAAPALAAPVLAALVLAALIPTAAPGLAQQPRDGVADALAGHQAEMDQLSGKDPMRRPLFFDPVDIESAPQGVPCNHLARRKPEAIAGSGHVVLMETAETPPRRLRYWQPPGPESAAEAEAKARHFAMGAAKTPEIRLLAARSFLWCR